MNYKITPRIAHVSRDLVLAYADRLEALLYLVDGNSETRTPEQTAKSLERAWETAQQLHREQKRRREK